MPDALSLSRSELPEEIEKAINVYRQAVKVAARMPVTSTIEAEGERYRALTAVILSRLGEAEARREEAEKQRDRARRGKEDDNAILREVMTENEQLRAANMKLQEIVAADDAKAIAEYEWERANLLAVGRDKAATARDAALARVERLEKELAEAKGPASPIAADALCPFNDEDAPDLPDGFDAADPCPVCGDLGSHDNDGKPIRCIAKDRR